MRMVRHEDDPMGARWCQGTARWQRPCGPMQPGRSDVGNGLPNSEMLKTSVGTKGGVGCSLPWP